MFRECSRRAGLCLRALQRGARHRMCLFGGLQVEFGIELDCVDEVLPALRAAVSYALAECTVFVCGQLVGEARAVVESSQISLAPSKRLIAPLKSPTSYRPVCESASARGARSNSSC